MVTKAEFLEFVNKVSNGTNTPEEWEKYVLQHYANVEIEKFRSELVRQVLGYISEEEVKKTLKIRLDIITDALKKGFSDE